MFRFLKALKRLEELEDTCQRLERTVKNLELEWDQTYEKFRLLNMRISKRVQQLDQAPETETAQPAGGDESQGSSLSDRQSKLQQQILERRNKLAAVRAVRSA